MTGDASAYEPVLSGKALAAIVGLPRRGQRQMIDLIRGLAEQPGQPGIYSTRDEHGHDLQHLRIGRWRVSF